MHNLLYIINPDSITNYIDSLFAIRLENNPIASPNSSARSRVCGMPHHYHVDGELELSEFRRIQFHYQELVG